MEDINFHTTTSALISKNAKLKAANDMQKIYHAGNMTKLETTCQKEKDEIQANFFNNMQDISNKHLETQLDLCNARIRDFKAFEESRQIENEKLHQALQDVEKKHKNELSKVEKKKDADTIFCEQKLDELKGSYTDNEKMRNKHENHIRGYR